MESTLPPLIIEDVPQAFLDLCKSDPELAPQFESPFTPSSTFVSLSASVSDKPLAQDNIDPTRLTNSYADAYTDTHGLHSGHGFIVKTGPAWPKREGPHPRPFRRELRPVNGHPIAPVWDDILTRIDVYLNGVKLPFTAVMPLSFANVGEEAFCGLVVVIGVEPEKVTFEDAKSVAEYAKLNILAEAGFNDVEVAVWEFETFLSGLKLPRLDPPLHHHLTEFHHPFTSTLGIPIAPLKQPWYEGSLGLFLTRDGAERLALTAAHVARPPLMFPNNQGLLPGAAGRHHGQMVALGYGAYKLAIQRIQNEVNHLQESIKRAELRAKVLQGRLHNGAVDTNGSIAAAITTIEQNMEFMKESIKQLSLLHSRVTQSMPIPENRSIGRVLYADPISVSSDGPDGYTRDWCLLMIRKDAFSDDFEGNTLYIGDKLEGETFLEHMFPDLAEREGVEPPMDGKLRIRGVVPLDEILRPKYLDANGYHAMAVVKNGRTTGTTVGWMSGLKSLVRYFKTINVEFTSRELTVVPYDNKLGRGPFSDEGDSGSIIVERGGRAVALLTGGGGITDSTDVTFATPYCELEKRMKEIFPSIRLLD